MDIEEFHAEVLYRYIYNDELYIQSYQNESFTQTKRSVSAIMAQNTRVHGVPIIRQCYSENKDARNNAFKLYHIPMYCAHVYNI